MIITCPACATRYVVPDSAVGADGRTVRCAKCRHSWFQDGPSAADAAPEPALAQPERVETPVAEARTAAPAPPPAAPRPTERQAAASPQFAPAEPAPGTRRPAAPAPAVDDFDEPPLSSPGEAAPPPPVYSDDDIPQYDAGRSTFDFEPPFRPRRNLARMWLVAAALFAVVALGAVAAVTHYGLPDWVPVSRPTFADAQPDLVLDFPPNRQDRRTLPNGTEFFGASGTITNVGQSRQSVPTILIVLRDGRERIVYSWEVVPPKRQLAPGESVTINEAVTDVPRSATAAEIGWKPG